MPTDKSIAKLYRELTELIYGSDSAANLGRDFLETTQSPAATEVNRVAGRQHHADDSPSSTPVPSARNAAEDSRHSIYRAAAALNAGSPKAPAMAEGMVGDDAIAPEVNEGVTPPLQNAPVRHALPHPLLFATTILVAVGSVGGLLIWHGAMEEHSPTTADPASAPVREGSPTGMTGTELTTPEKALPTPNTPQDGPTAQPALGPGTPLDVPDAASTQLNVEPAVAAPGAAAPSEIPPSVETALTGAAPGTNAAAASNPRQTGRPSRRHSIRRSQHAKRSAIRAPAR
jgi:hypothetical protein